RSSVVDRRKIIVVAAEGRPDFRALPQSFLCQKRLRLRRLNLLFILVRPPEGRDDERSLCEGEFEKAGPAAGGIRCPARRRDRGSFMVTEQIFEGLVRLKPGTTKIVPALATSWKLTGGKTWTFNLRKGVKFQDGTPWNAAAACYNFNRWYNWTGAFQDPSATF